MTLQSTRQRDRGKIVPAKAILTALAVVLSVSSAAFADCNEPETGTNNTPILSPPLSEVVIGAGRLQFHSAPASHCAMKGVFVIPKDVLIAYAASDDGWSSVMYINPKTGDHVEGWVRSSR